jgi:hypothetical protein
MKLFTLETAQVANPPTEPEFTAEGLLLPEEYFKVFQIYLDAIYTELDKLNFSAIVIQCMIDGIGPQGGFMPWLEEAALLMWVMCLKHGRSSSVFFPANVAADVYKIAKDIYATRRIAQSEVFNNLSVN